MFWQTLSTRNGNLTAGKKLSLLKKLSFLSVSEPETYLMFHVLRVWFLILIFPHSVISLRPDMVFLQGNHLQKEAP